MVLINPRDVEIFRLLASGPIPARQIRLELSQFYGNRKVYTTDVVDDVSRNMSKGALKERIKDLRKGKYIKSRNYPIKKAGNRKEALYALTDNGKSELYRDGYEPNHIRSTFPPASQVSHELEVVGVVKSLKRNAYKSGYRFNMEDENYLKAQTKGTQKNIPYPDLHTAIFFSANGKSQRRDIAVEVDNETATYKRVILKAVRVLEHHGWSVLVLAPTSRRINTLKVRLRNFLKEEAGKAAKDSQVLAFLKKAEMQIAFGTLSEFHAKGFLSSQWESLVGVKTAAIPKNHKPMIDNIKKQ